MVGRREKQGIFAWSVKVKCQGSSFLRFLALASVLNLPDCWWGFNCRTQQRPDHAARYNVRPLEHLAPSRNAKDDWHSAYLPSYARSASIVHYSFSYQSVKSAGKLKCCLVARYTASRCSLLSAYTISYSDCAHVMPAESLLTCFVRSRTPLPRTLNSS